MQVPPVPPIALPNALPQDAVAKTVPQAQMQAAQPVIQRAVDPSQKSNRGNQSRSNSDRSKGGDKTDNDRGRSVNMKV